MHLSDSTVKIGGRGRLPLFLREKRESNRLLVRVSNLIGLGLYYKKTASENGLIFGGGPFKRPASRNGISKLAFAHFGLNDFW